MDLSSEHTFIVGKDITIDIFLNDTSETQTNCLSIVR